MMISQLACSSYTTGLDLHHHHLSPPSSPCLSPFPPDRSSRSLSGILLPYLIKTEPERKREGQKHLVSLWTDGNEELLGALQRCLAILIDVMAPAASEDDYGSGSLDFFDDDNNKAGGVICIRASRVGLVSLEFFPPPLLHSQFPTWNASESRRS